jgi:chloramphenicol-sensitive protein RarD
VNESAETRAGLGYGFSAYLLWGLFPLFFPLLAPAGWLEILAQRILWSLVVVAALLLFTRRGFAGVGRVLRNRYQFVRLAGAAFLITINWAVYIWGVNSGHVVECSLGYFINPLFTILLGVVILKERLRPAQWAAVGIGTLAVIVIAVDYGRPPWIALTLAVSFGLYGFLKKKARVGAADSLVVETGVLAIPSAIALIFVAAHGDLAFAHHSPGNTLLLASSGIVTAVPLLCFAAATQRLPLSVVGLLQYLTPVLQFIVGVGIRHESVPTAEFLGFCLVWLALIILTIDGLRYQRTAMRVGRNAETVAA